MSESLTLLRIRTLSNSDERAAEVWGSRGRRFKSCHPDWDKQQVRGRFGEIRGGLFRGFSHGGGVEILGWLLGLAGAADLDRWMAQAADGMALRLCWPAR